jgi:hypothetical protein
MRVYLVSINGRNYEKVRASRAAVAVHRAMDRYREGDLDGATITIRRGEKIKYGYRIVADVPCEPAGSTKRDFVSETFGERSASVTHLHEMRLAHPEYVRLAVRRVEVV